MSATIVYHGGCPDGFTAAWLIHDWLVNVKGEGRPNLVAAQWGDEPPADRGDDLYVVDYCYEPEQLEQIVDMGGGRLVILDHHETSRGWLVDTFGPGRVITSAEHVTREPNEVDRLIVCDMERSGAGLAAWYTGSRPPVVDFVQDRDLWAWKLDGTAEAFAAVTSFPYTIDAWNQLASMTHGELIRDGAAINRYRNQLVEQTVETAYQRTVLGYERIWVAAAPYAIGSDVAGELAKRDPDRFAGYFVDYGTRRKWGLRSTPTGLNVARLAATVGGGGHAHAAGFEVES